MSKRTADFVIRLSQDPELKERYRADPAGTMSAEGLDADAQAVLQSNDQKAIADHLGDDAPPGCFVVE
ncbi:MAG: hypothetical protein OEU54_10425 [Gemmatimonadota bacterium]|nr:hypothetical protein [Gemmatimonadota bacterium]